MIDELRCITYLAPGIPEGFFAVLVRYLGQRLGVRSSLTTDARTSGPSRGDADPFSAARVEIGWMCAPSYLWLKELRPSPVRLIRAGPVFGDPRIRGEPVFFAETIVRRDHPARSFEELRGGRWAFNDPCSLSGYFSVLEKLAELGHDGSFFARARHSGSHLDSIRMVLEGEADAATIDSNVLGIETRSRPGLRDRIRVIATSQPYPIQPMVARSCLAPEHIAEIAAALLEVGEDPETARALGRFGVARFAPVSEASYERERRALRVSEQVLGRGKAAWRRSRPPDGFHDLREVV